MILTILMIAMVQSAATPDAESGKVAALNAAIQHHNDEIVERARKDEAKYRAERKAYEAALAENNRARQTAQEQDAAYKTARASYEAKLAEYQKATGKSAPSGTPERPTAPANGHHCRSEAPTGTTLKSRVCD